MSIMTSQGFPPVIGIHQMISGSHPALMAAMPSHYQQQQGSSQDKSPNFLAQLAGVREKEVDLVLLDHAYSKPWSAHPDASNAKPVRLLFMDKFQRSQPVTSRYVCVMFSI